MGSLIINTLVFFSFFSLLNITENIQQILISTILTKIKDTKQSNL